MTKREMQPPRRMRLATAPEPPDVEEGIARFMAGFGGKFAVNPERENARIVKR